MRPAVGGHQLERPPCAAGPWHYRQRVADVPREPAEFYVRLLRSGPNLRVTALLVISQVANAAGFARESRRSRR